MIQLRPHQTETVVGTDQGWQSHQNVLSVLPTGAGKTFVMGEFARRALHSGEVCFVFAHRDVLLSQLSKSLCLMGVSHQFIASKPAIKNVTNNNQVEFGNSFFDKESPVFLISVDTFIRRLDHPGVQRVIKRVKYWLIDEAHHVLADNKWGKCIAPLSHAKGLGVTATPIRADGKGLGRHAQGVFDHLYVGSNQGVLMARGMLTLYKIFIPPTKLNVEGMRITSSGDYSQKVLAERTDRRDITGDAVEHYLKYVGGRQAITFCVNIAHSEHVAAQFNEAGIPSISLSSKTPTAQLEKALNDFRQGRYLNLCNCDLFGEGFDVPAVVAVIMLRKTESYSLFKQQFGRCLRPSEGKTHGVLIDHVGNVKRHCIHGAPHDDPTWTLDETKNKKGDGSRHEGRICPECWNFYIPKSANQYICPECNHEETRQERIQAEQDYQHEEGHLVELEIDFINELINKRSEVDQPVHLVKQRMQNAPSVVRNSVTNQHVKRQHAQTILRGWIQHWCQLKNPDNQWDVKTVQNMFALEFGIHVYEAQILSEIKAYKLVERIRKTL